MIWTLESWEHPCYNVNNGRCVSLFKWRNSKNYIYEETTNNIIPILSLKRPHSRALYLSIILLLITFCVKYQTIINNNIKINYYNDDNINDKILQVRYEIIYMYIGATFSRLIFGYIADIIGIRESYCIVIVLSVIFNIFNIYFDSVILKILSGISSAGFVLSELWVIIMFDKNILGLSTGIIGGIGNFGMGLSLIINYLIISNSNIKLQNYYIYWPYIIYLLLIYPIYYMSDDSPYGNFRQLKKLYDQYTNENTNENTNLDNSIYSDNSHTVYSLDNYINIEDIISDISYSKKNVLVYSKI